MQKIIDASFLHSTICTQYEPDLSGEGGTGASPGTPSTMVPVVPCLPLKQTNKPFVPAFGKQFLTQIKDPVEMGPDVIIDWTAAGRLPVSMLTALLIMF